MNTNIIILSAAAAALTCVACGDKEIVSRRSEQLKGCHCRDCFKELKYGKIPSARKITSNRFSPR